MNRGPQSRVPVDDHARPLVHANTIAEQRDRSLQEIGFARALYELLPINRLQVSHLYKPETTPVIGVTTIIDHEGLHHVDDDLGWPDDAFPAEQAPHLHSTIFTRALRSDVSESGWRTVIPITRLDQVCGFVELFHSEALTASQKSAASEVARLYSNCVNLLDYSEVDTLTGLLNRKTFEDKLLKMVSVANRQLELGEVSPNQVWLGVLDIDHFKRVNDTFGHLIGDEVLLLVASAMKNIFRGEDKLFRFGGEEFVVLLHACKQATARAVFDAFRSEIESRAFPQVGNITVSGGFTALRPNDTPNQLLERADKALYYAKEHGRNQVHLFEDLVDRGEVSISSLDSEVELF